MVRAPTADVLAAFERLWAAYPKRALNPKAPARDLFVRRVREGANPDDLVEAAARFATACKVEGIDPKFVPHTRTWLSQGQYRDYLPSEAPASAEPQPSPEPLHQLAFMRAEIGDAAWASWVAPLTVDAQASPVVITANTKLALDHVRKAYGARIEAECGPVDWRIAPRRAS